MRQDAVILPVLGALSSLDGIVCILPEGQSHTECHITAGQNRAQLWMLLRLWLWLASKRAGLWSSRPPMGRSPPSR